jgi:hypothetical protein
MTRNPKHTERTPQVNVTVPEGMRAAWLTSAALRKQSLSQWLRDAAEYWERLCAEADEVKRTPHELIERRYADHLALDTVVADLQTLAQTRALADSELALLRRLSPETWRALTGVDR